MHKCIVSIYRAFSSLTAGVFGDRGQGTCVTAARGPVTPLWSSVLSTEEMRMWGRPALARQAGG